MLPLPLHASDDNQVVVLVADDKKVPSFSFFPLGIVLLSALLDSSSLLLTGRCLGLELEALNLPYFRKDEIYRLQKTLILKSSSASHT